MFNFFFGKKALQNFFRKLLGFALLGLNYSSAKKYNDNGEKNLLKKLAKQFSDKELVILDVGANIGEYSASVIESFEHKNFHLFSFEPSKPTFQTISKRFTEDNRITVLNKGLSNEAKSIQLFYDKETSGLSSVYNRDLRHTSVNFTESETIEVITLDMFCIENEIENIDFLKLDVEGHELEVLHGATNTLKNSNIKVLQFEFGGCNIDSRTYFKDFYFHLEHDFNIYRIVRDGIHPIKTYSEKLEIFQSSNFVAIHKSLSFNL